MGRGGSRGAEERSAKAEEEDGNRRGGGAGSGEPLSPGAFAFTRVAARPDGRELAVGDARGRVRIFDLETLEERLVLAAHDGAVTALAYDGDGVDAETTTLVSAGEDGAAHAFDASLPEPTSDDEAASAERGEAGRTPRAPHGEGRLRAASKKQKQKPASGSHPHVQRVVNANPPDERARTAGSARRSGAVAFAAFAGSRLALFRGDGAATAYARVPSGARASTFARCDEGLASSPDASLEPARGFGLADVSVSGGGGFRSGEEGSGGEGEGTTTRRVVAIALGADGCIRRRETALVSGGGARAGANPIRASASPPSARRIVRLRLTPPSAGAASAFALAPSGGACAVSSADGGVRTFDPATGACVGVGFGHAGAGARGGGVRAMAYVGGGASGESDDETFLVTGDDDGCVFVWRTPRREGGPRTKRRDGETAPLRGDAAARPALAPIDSSSSSSAAAGAVPDADAALTALAARRREEQRATLAMLRGEGGESPGGNDAKSKRSRTDARDDAFERRDDAASHPPPPPGRATYAAAAGGERRKTGSLAGESVSFSFAEDEPGGTGAGAGVGAGAGAGAARGPVGRVPRRLLERRQRRVVRAVVSRVGRPPPRVGAIEGGRGTSRGFGFRG